MTARQTFVLLLAIGACSRSAAPGRAAPAPERAPAAPAPRDASRPPASPSTPADARFMSDMHVHHAQALVMGRWAVDSSHGASDAVRSLAERIVVGQRDEMAFMERWLVEHGATAPAHHHGMLMPGMLSDDQLARLAQARGAGFDRLFLTFMMQHHQGAITMVDGLLGAQGGARDGRVFKFATDIHADQSAEIARMRRLLAALFTGGNTP